MDINEGEKVNTSIKVECGQGKHSMCEGNSNSIGSIGWSSNTSCMDLSKFDSMSIR